MKKISRFIVLFFGAVLFANAALAAERDIVDTAVHTKNLSTLVAAIKAAGLVDTLKGQGPFTVFAPTNKAFCKIAKGNIRKVAAE
jgi:uncharacterized surface protein with fasciclin (FAS1) repeats